jgi:hypothetical protein
MIPAYSREERGLRVPGSTFGLKQEVTAGLKKHMVGFMNCTSGKILFKEYQIEVSKGSMEGKHDDDDDDDDDDDNNNNNNNLGVSNIYLQRCVCNTKFSSVYTLVLMLWSTSLIVR